VVVSSSGQGPTQAANGLAADGDNNGDVAIAWVQGSSPAPEIVAAQLYQPPGGVAPLRDFQYERSDQPLLAWSAAKEPWGPVRYAVTLDGAAIGQTEGTAARVPAPLSNGPHSWQLTATNPVGQQTDGGPATIFVDTVAPTLSFRLSGVRRIDTPIELYARFADRPPAGQPRTDASGIASVVIRWGDGTRSRLTRHVHRRFHAYLRPGRYEISVVATDKAGNRTRVVAVVRIAEHKAGK